MLNLVLFGAPGSGKGTQSDKLIKKYNLIHLSTGELLRREKEQKTELGIEADKLMSQGKLVPDAVVNAMISNKLDANKSAKGFIFDGFPRTVAQAEALDQLLISKSSAISTMIALNVDDAELMQRLLLRGKASGRADDANPEVIRKRLNEYHSKTEIVAEFYKEQHKFISVNGMGEINDVFDAISAIIDSL